MMHQQGFAGPVLHFRGFDSGCLRLAAITIRPDDASPGDIMTGTGPVPPVLLVRVAGLSVWRHDFMLTGADKGYRLEGRDYPVVTRLDADMRIAFVSCDGEENGDLDRDPVERDVMWTRLRQDHDRAPFALLLQGGDQIYADEATRGHPLSDSWPDEPPATTTPGQLNDLSVHLQRKFVERYLRALAGADHADLLAMVPSLSVWDDHDICDGWGSLPEDRTDSAVGRTLFAVARQMYLLFQHGAVDPDIPCLFTDPSGQSLSWRRDLPGVTLFAPDLRSERRRDRVMGEAGWQGVGTLESVGDHVFMISSVPLLGPRLSLMETLLKAIPWFRHYDDDLRDQWQSHAHRKEWRRMLKQVLRLRQAAPVTILSGEIHLATRAEMGPEATVVDQLVASGISHRAPPGAYARALGLFAGLGDAPLKGHPIRIRPLPGRQHRYVAERNYLTLSRKDGRWTAAWHLEHGGVTPPLALD